MPKINEVIAKTLRRASRSSTTAYSPGLLKDRKSTRLNSSHIEISYAVFCLKKKTGDGERDQDLELRRLAHARDDAGQPRPQVRDGGREVSLGDRPAVELDPLGVRAQVRRRRHARAQAPRPQDRLQECGGGALAVGAGDQRSRPARLRMSQLVQDGPHAVQPQLHAEAAEAGDVLQRLGVAQPGLRASSA